MSVRPEGFSLSLEQLPFQTADGEAKRFAVWQGPAEHRALLVVF